MRSCSFQQPAADRAALSPDRTVTRHPARRRSIPGPSWVRAIMQMRASNQDQRSEVDHPDVTCLLLRKDRRAPQHGSYIRRSELVGWPMGSPSQHARTNGMQRVTYTLLTDCRIFRRRQCLGCFCNHPGLIILTAHCGGLDRVDSVAGSSDLTGYLRHSRRRQKRRTSCNSCLYAPRTLGPKNGS